jgi:ABC-type antimicrobial peptide transport system permease subunit
MRARTAGALVGVVFGVALSWSVMTSPNVIRQALLFEKSYLFLLFASAVLTAFVGQRVLLASRSARS